MVITQRIDRGELPPYMKHDLANKLIEYGSTHDQGATSVLPHILFLFYFMIYISTFYFLLYFCDLFDAIPLQLKGPLLCLLSIRFIIIIIIIATSLYQLEDKENFRN